MKVAIGPRVCAVCASEVRHTDPICWRCGAPTASGAPDVIRNVGSDNGATVESAVVDDATVNRSLLRRSVPSELPAVTHVASACDLESAPSKPVPALMRGGLDEPLPEWMRSPPRPPSAPAGLTPAPVSARLVAQLADCAVVFALLLPVYVILGFMIAVAPDALGAASLLFFFFNYIGGPLLVATYIVRRIASTGQTIGKRWLGIKVVGADTGLPIGMERSITRYLMFIVMALPLYLGYLSILSDNSGRNRGWHDQKANTIVVST